MSPFLHALAGKNKSAPPIWIMRQAGRYLPEYRKLRENYPLRDLFFTPELAVEITLMPIRRFAFDAAILFADIAHVSLMLGRTLDFKEGPVILPNATPQDTFTISDEPLEIVRQIILALKKELKVPLIGFCAEPFTLATYMIEKDQAKRWLYSDPESFHRLLSSITEASLRYLSMQIEAGVDAVQIFDSGSHVLSQSDFLTFSWPYTQKLIQTSVPTILFSKHSSRLLPLPIPCALSVDWSHPIASFRQALGPSIPLQGNLDPDLLFAPPPIIKRETQKLLSSMKNDPAFIVNLGHGIKPTTPLISVETLINCVRNNFN